MKSIKEEHLTLISGTGFGEQIGGIIGAAGGVGSLALGGAGAVYLSESLD